MYSSVDQGTENPRVGCSIHPLATNLFNDLRRFQAFPKKPLREFCVTLTDTQAPQNHQLGLVTASFTHTVCRFNELR